MFVLTDNQRWDALGVMQREMGARARFPWFQTPHLDRLTQEGALPQRVLALLALPGRANASQTRRGIIAAVIPGCAGGRGGHEKQETLLTKKAATC